MYWNSERILDSLDEWVVLLKLKGTKPQGTVYYKNVNDGWFEIFGIDMDLGTYDTELFKELLQAALSDAKHRNGKVMTFFCDEEYEQVAKECGFECIGNYLCYKTHLS
jgi:hypothetical protein